MLMSRLLPCSLFLRTITVIIYEQGNVSKFLKHFGKNNNGAELCGGNDNDTFMVNQFTDRY